MDEKFWNNITVNTSIYSNLGPQVIILETSSPDANYDDDFKTIYVYDRTNITNVSVSNLNPFRGEEIQIYALLRWANSSNISNQILRFQDIYLNETNQTGWAKVNYVIPTSAPL